MGASRIDLILANGETRQLVRNLEVMLGGWTTRHHPVFVELEVSGAAQMEWRIPRPQVPELLKLPYGDLRQSEEWKTLALGWRDTKDVGSWAGGQGGVWN